MSCNTPEFIGTWIKSELKKITIINSAVANLTHAIKMNLMN